jgi:glycosyltransferase involved in cell wall biosynthesis
MNVLFLLPRYSEESNNSTLEKELVLEFSKNGHKTSVVSLLETNEKYTFKSINNIDSLKVNCGKYYEKGTNKIAKGLTMLKVPYLLPKFINKYINKNIDLIILSTPMMNNPKLMKKLKEYYTKSKIVLIVWDIFPQNGVDLEIIKNKILIKYFDRKYRTSLRLADKISAMSLGNKNYLIEKLDVNHNKIFILKNWAIIKPKEIINKQKIREKYGYEENDFIAIFGGNMGKPQKLENILSLAEKVLDYDDVKFLFIGSGTEKERLERYSKDKNLKNINFLNQVPREDYEKLTAACDIGVVSLDERFTVPNFPSKTTDYFKLSLPILASLDSCAAKDYGVFLAEKVKGGLFAQAGNIEELYEKFMILYTNENLRKEFGENGRKYYEENLGVDKAYKILMKKIKN